MESTTREITPAEWERHRENILKLRQSGVSLKGNKGKDGIIETMGKNHNFHASRAQYERQFGKWGLQRNLNPTEWRRILQFVDQREEDGMRCTVLKNGELVQPSTLRRKRKLHCQGLEYTENRGLRVSHASLPECVKIKIFGLGSDDSRTLDIDAREDNSTFAAFDLPAITNTSAPIRAITQAVVPDGFGMDSLESYNQTPGISQMSPAQTTLVGVSSTLVDSVSGPSTFRLRSLDGFPRDHPSIDHFDLTDEQYPNSREPFQLNGQASLSRVLPNQDIFTDFNSIPSAKSNRLSGNLSFLGPNMLQSDTVDFESRVWEDLGIPANDTNVGYSESQEDPGLRIQPTFFIQQPVFDNQSPSMALIPFEEPESSSARQLHMPRQSPLSQVIVPSSDSALFNMERLQSRLLSLLPLDKVSSLSPLKSNILPEYEVFGPFVNRLVIFSIENNFAGFDGVPIGDIWSFLKRDSQIRSRLLQYYRTIPRHIFKALAENLIRAAIEACDAAAVSEQLSTDLVVLDDIVFTVDGFRYTAVERSTMLGSYQVTKALLDAQADVNKTVENNPFGHRGALQLALRTYPQNVSVDINIISLLLKHGAKVRTDHLKDAVDRQDANSIRQLLSNFSPSEYRPTESFISDFMVKALSLLDEELATLTIIYTVQGYIQPGSSGDPKLMSQVLQYLLASAAKRGYLGLVTFLYGHVTERAGALAGAVRSGRKDVWEFLLEQGADVDSPAYCIEDMQDDQFNTTPLAEAIRADNNEVLHDLETRGALSRINEPGRFGTAIHAAAEVGKLDNVQRILRSAPGMTGTSLSLALSVSIEKGHEGIALTLLKAGANVNFGYSSRRPLRQALRQKNINLVYAIMECDVDVNHGEDNTYLCEAARWGDRSVIETILWMGADVNAMVDNGKVFSAAMVTAAVMSKNVGLVMYLVHKHGALLDVSPTSCQSKYPSPLSAATKNKDIDMVNTLLNLGADPACPMAITIAASQDVEILAVLLRAFRTRYPEGKKGFGADALRIALEKEDSKVLDMLLGAKLDVNKLDVNILSYRGKVSESYSAFGMAIHDLGTPNPDLIRKLISAGGDPNGIASRRNSSFLSTASPRETALLLAIGTKSMALVELLIDEGADVRRPARLGLKRTPLQRACEVGSMEIVELLLTKGVDVNEPPAVRGGGTSLQLCAITGCVGIAYRLLKQGARIHAAPSEVNGRTALEGAAEYGRLDMLKILWDVAGHTGFSWEECDRAVKLAEGNGHMGCRHLIREEFLPAQGLAMAVDPTIE